MGRVFEIAFAINATMQPAFASTMSRSSIAMQQLNETTRVINAEQRQLDRTWNEGQERIRAYASQLQRLHTQLQQGRISDESYRMSAQRISQQMQSCGMSAEEYRGHMQRLRAEMEQTRGSQDRMRASMAAQQAAQARFSAAKAGFMSGTMGVAMVAAPLVGIVETAASFEAAMSKVKAISGATGEEFQQLTNVARDLGEKTKFSARQAADGMTYLAQAGWNSQQIIAGMPGLLNLAAAAGVDLAQASEIVSDNLNAFGLRAEDAQHMADVYAVCANETSTDVQMIGETMKYAAPVAHAFGATMEETAALTGLMANSGIKASQAGTALRAGFLRLAGPPKMAQNAMDSLGMSMQDITAEQKEAAMAMESLGIRMSDTEGPRKMTSILRDLKDKMADLGQEEKLATLKAIFGQEAATGWLAVLEAGPDVFDELVTKMEQADGAAEEMANIMQDNAKGAADNLKSAMESVAISIGSMLLPTLASAGRVLADWTGGLSKVAAAHPALIQGSIGFSAALAGLYLYVKATTVASAAFGVAQAGVRAAMLANTVASAAAANAGQAYGAAARIATIAQWAWNAAMTANPVGLVIAAIVAAVAVVYLLYTHFERIQAFCATLWESPAAAVIAFATGPIGWLIYAAAGIISNWETVKTWFVTLWENPSAAISQFAGFITGKLSGVWSAITGAWDTAIGALGNLWDGFCASIDNAWSAACTAVYTAWSVAVNDISLGWDLIKAGATGFVTGFINIILGLPGAIAFAIGFAIGYISELPNKIMNMVTTAGTFLMALPAVCLAAGAAFVTTAENWLSSAYNSVVTWLTNTLTSAAEFLMALPEKCLEAGVAFIAAAENWLSTAYNSVVAWLSATVNDAYNFLMKLPEECSTAGAAFVAAAESWAGNAYNAVMNWINQIPSAISNALSGAWDSIKAEFSTGFSVGVHAAQNAKGGIYQKGAFLTTFAEESAEAAIPLDGSPRAIGLWEQAGRMLGVGKKNDSETPAAAIELSQQTAESPRIMQTIETAGENNDRRLGKEATGGVNVTVPPISISLNFYGQTEPGKVKETVLAAGQQVQKSFADQMKEFQHERGRVSFA